MRIVQIGSSPVERFVGTLSEEDCRRTADALARLRDVLAERRIWHVNSTPTGGGVAELLASLLPYERAAGVDVGWLVIDGSDDFFEITKRLHHRLHEADGDGGPLGPAERAVYDRVLQTESGSLMTHIEPGDVVVMHDPQTAGLIPSARAAGARVIWRCHIGVDEPRSRAREGWAFLADDVRAADRCVFSRTTYVWDILDPDATSILAPCVDVLSPKNRSMSAATCWAFLQRAGIASGDHRGSPSRDSEDLPSLRAVARMIEASPLPTGTPIVLQVSRWDPLKDHEGVLRAFVEHCAAAVPDAHLVLAGPETESVDDDPESQEVFAQLRSCWDSQPASVRSRVHLASLPMHDANENATMVNSLQQVAEVVAQKSLAEGFGLTVAEAMWKRRPVAASRVGGIQDQIVDGTSGMLVEPTDLGAFGSVVTRLLSEKALAEEVGSAAHRRVCDRFLPFHHFEGEVALVEALSG